MWQRTAGVVGPRRCTVEVERNVQESSTTEGESPVLEDVKWHSGILSNAEHEEFCANPPGPSGKAKYSDETDSEPVP